MKIFPRIVLWTLLTVTIRGGACRAQYVRLNPGNGRQALYFDMSRVANYNHYEHWRWGGGFYWVTPSPTLGPQWQVQAYAAYGIRDRHVKYGFDIAHAHRAPHWWRPFAGISDDLVQNSSAVIDNAFSLLQSEDNVALVASQFVRQQALRAGASGRWNRLQVMTEWRYMRQRILFDGTRSLYPTLGDTVPDWCHLAEWHCQTNLSGLTADLRGGTALETPGWWYLRALLQYERQYPVSKGHFELFGQAGCAVAGSETRTTALHRTLECFDMGGTYNSHYCFRNSLLTLPPECFMADRFARANVRYQLPVVGWTHRMSMPQPFVQATTTMGRHYGGNEWSVVGETAVGVTGLLLWNHLDLGCAVARQLLNTSTGNITLRPDNRHDRWAFVVCAKMILQ